MGTRMPFSPCEVITAHKLFENFKTKIPELFFKIRKIFCHLKVKTNIYINKRPEVFSTEFWVV